MRIDHQVRVFVFQVLDRGAEFLLLRQRPAAEWPPGPVVGTIRPEERLQDAVVREVEWETGITRPVHIMDLQIPGKELFGDIGLVEWPFAYQAGAPSSPVTKVCPGPTIEEFAWMNFAQAFEQVGNERDREALVRLQVSLQS